MTNVYAPGHAQRNWYANQINNVRGSTPADMTRHGWQGYGESPRPAYAKGGGGGGGYGGYGGWGGKGGGGAGGGGGAPNGNYDTSIDAGPVWSQGQIQNQVNSLRARNDAASGQAQQRLGSRLASRGMTGPSGIGASLAASLAAQAGANSADQETQLRFNAAQQNAQHTLASQNARAQEGLGLASLLQRQQEAAVAAQQNQQNSIMGMLMGLMR